MDKTMLFARLDYFTIKPYLTLKNMLIFIVIALIMIFSSGEGASAIGILMVYGAIFASYPFAVGEKNGIDGLYTILSIKRKTVVKGRYIFSFLISLCTALLACFFSVTILLLLNKEAPIVDIFMTALILLFVFTLIQAIQLPIFFKLGYERARLIAYLPFIGLTVAVLVVANMMENVAFEKTAYAFIKWAWGKPTITVLIIVVLWIMAIAISYKLSLKFYRRRDF